MWRVVIFCRMATHRHSRTSPVYVCYYRVSTQKQGQSGLGLDAQKESINTYLGARAGVVIGEFTETESGKRADRKELHAALTLCQRKRAVLVIAKLDRLARNVAFIASLMDSGVEFVAVDQPTKDRFMLHVQAAFAEEEARRISQRTKEALAAAKRRGVDVGASGRVLAQRHRQEALERAKGFAEAFRSVAASGARTTAQFRDELNRQGLPGPGGGRWHLPNTYRTLRRLGMEPWNRAVPLVA